MTSGSQSDVIRDPKTSQPMKTEQIMNIKLMTSGSQSDVIRDPKALQPMKTEQNNEYKTND